MKKLKEFAMCAARLGTLIACATALWGQTGQITGRVTDQNSAPMPDVKVTIREIATNTTRVTQTNQDGFYSAPSLLPGDYQISFEKTGFKTFTRTGLTLQVGQDARLDTPLQLGSVSEKIEVKADVPALETETHSTGEVVEARQVTELPLLGRDAYALGELVPGVRTSRGMNDLPVDIISTASISINGAQGNANEFLLDGAPNSAPSQNGPLFYPIADAVQEFKVDTSNYSAEFGRAAGGVFNVVTKSGTNDVHFEAWEFLRNNDLNANNYFANLAGQPIAPLKFNQFGGTFGAPVFLPKLHNGRNKTFFFVATEIVRYIEGVTYTATVPNPAYLTGNFAGDVNGSGQPVVIYNPFTTRQVNGAYVRDPFPGNIIPGSLLSPIAANLKSYFPAPNTNGTGPTHQNNLVRTDSDVIQKNTWTERLDHNFSENTRAFERYSYDDSPFTRASPYGYGDIGSPGYGPQDFVRYNAVAEVDHVFSPSLIGTLRASFSRLVNARGPISQGFDLTQLGFPAGLANKIGAPAAFPVIEIAGYTVASSVSNNSAAYLFFADHGESMGSHGMFRKVNPYDEAIRTPMIISSGQSTFKGWKRGKMRVLSNSVDIPVTTLGLCGIAKPNWMEGTDYSHYRLPKPAAGKEPDSAYLQNVVPVGHPDSINTPYRGIVTKAGWKFVAFENQSWLMFNLNEDPYEEANLAFNNMFRAERKQLLGRLKQWVSDTGDRFSLPAD